MNRRDTIKSVLLGSVAISFGLSSCWKPNKSEKHITKLKKLSIYGRTKEEIIRDNALLEENFFTEHELLTIATLCDIILPKNQEFESAHEVGVTKFIDFIVKDIPKHKTPLREGIIWLDAYSTKLFDKEFINCSDSDQLSICDQIAYPKKTKPELIIGEKFFTRMRNLTLSGYYTSEIGIKELGYKGNTPNVWDGVPEEVLQDLGMKYDEDWLKKCIDQSKRGDIAVWDKDGNLLS